MGAFKLKIFILGSSGYIGKHLIVELEKFNYKVFGYDLEESPIVGQEYKHFQGDVRDPILLKQTLIEVDPHIVIDLASLTVVGDSYVLDDYDHNYATPKHLLDSLQNLTQFNLKKVIFTSTQYVIGPEYSGLNPMGYAPHTVYGQSKVILEQEIRDTINGFCDFGIEVSIVRPTNVWGGDHPKYSTLWEGLLAKGVVMIPNIKVLKSYCHISTLCDLYLSLASKKPKFGSFKERIVYGTDELMSQDEWVSLQVKALRTMGIKARYWKVPVFVLRMVSALLSFLGAKNPLPQSRVDSMLVDYPVILDRPFGVASPKDKLSVEKVAHKDIQFRYSRDKHL